MPIDEKLITPEILNNTLKQEIYPEIRVEALPRMGKVRTVYDIGDFLIMMSSDNLSVFDVVLLRQVFGKGENLDAISAHFFDRTRHIIGNHYIKTIAPNTWLVQKAQPVMVEFVFRKYLTGSGWDAYAEDGGPEKGTVFCGVPLRPGYRRNEELDHVIFTPTAKGKAGDFDIPEFKGLKPEKDDPKLTVDVIRKNYRAFGFKKVEDVDLLIDDGMQLYRLMHSELGLKGYLLADTKWEFGYSRNGKLLLIDECVTPDSSRIWNRARHIFDPEKNEFTVVQDDKQHFRDHIKSKGLHKEDRKKELAEYWMPDDVLAEGVLKYCRIRQAITGTQPEITAQPKKQLILEALARGGYLR